MTTGECSGSVTSVNAAGLPSEEEYEVATIEIAR